jgi:hypothetical protein
MSFKRLITLVLGGLMIAAAILSPGRALAHCDTMSGPVIQAARQALDTGNVNRVLIWVQTADENDIKRAFQQTLAVRKLSPEAKEFADMYFFETLVRIHRAGEGAPYTGLKPEGSDTNAAITCADKALDTGKVEPLLELISDAVREGIEGHFEDVMKRKKYEINDIQAGRAYVEAYVTYTHYVERIYEAATHPVAVHGSEAQEGGSHVE